MSSPPIGAVTIPALLDKKSSDGWLDERTGEGGPRRSTGKIPCRLTPQRDTKTVVNDVVSATVGHPKMSERPLESGRKPRKIWGIKEVEGARTIDRSA